MRYSYLLILLVLPFMIVGCQPAPNFWQDAKAGQKRILVTFPPLFSITHAVAGEDAYVLCLLTTQGPHGYDGAPTDLIKVNKADILIFNGLTLDNEFVNKMKAGRTNIALRILDVGQTLHAAQPRQILKSDGRWHFMPDGTKHKHGDLDPHLWLGPPQAIEMTKIIADSLAEFDPAHAEAYKGRAAKFIDELKSLERDGKAALKDKANKKIITMHESFAYFAAAFDIKITASIQQQPGADSDAKSLAELIKHCKKPDGPRVIAVEPQYSKAQAELIVQELKEKGISVRIITLDPLETADIAAGQKFNPDPGHYLKTMRKNIDTLAEALR